MSAHHRQPIVPIDMLLYTQVKPRRQTRPDACTSFAVAHALQLQTYLKTGLMEVIDGEDLHKKVLKEYYKVIPKKRSRSFPEVLSYLEKNKIIHSYAPLDNTRITITRWLTKQRIPLLEWHTNKYTHALAAVGFDHDKEEIYCYDGLKSDWRIIHYEDIPKQINKTWIIFLNS